MLIVQKYGGSSLANSNRIFTVAKKIVDAYKLGHKLVVILSAQGNATDELIKKATDINKNPSKREMDVLLSTGEQQSIALMALAIHDLGYPAVSLTGFQVPILTSSIFGDARIKEVFTEKINIELDKNNIVIVAGFQGFNKQKEITTLGRGGSDTTAVAVAASLKADICEIYTDVDGVYTGDPKIVKNARKLQYISYDEMLEFANLGANVLHNRSVEMAKRYNLSLVVKSSFTNEEGTEVRKEKEVEKNKIKGVAIDKNVAIVNLNNMENKSDNMFNIYSILSSNSINIDIITQSSISKNIKNISFTVKENEINKVLSILDENIKILKYESIDYNLNVAKLSIIGNGMDTNSAIGAKFFESLHDCNVTSDLISTSESKISIIAEDTNIEKLANIVHDRFLYEYNSF